MPSFKAPVYSKLKNQSTGKVEPCYTFPILWEESDEKLSMVLDNHVAMTTELLQECLEENKEWWNGFVASFLKHSAKLFSKTYTVQEITKITKHIHSSIENSVPSFPATLLYFPTQIQIIGGVFWIQWMYTLEPFMIDIPVFEESIPIVDKVTEIEEVNLEKLALDSDSTEEIQLQNPNQFYERQKVKEARLKAKLAMYKAQDKMTRYYEKYGNVISDSESEEESESESEDA
jgi:hypothetical protein